MSAPHKLPRYDVVVVGAGHNGLVSAAYLAEAGLSVLVLERLGTTGGAAVSQELFPGRPAKLSRFSYLVSLFPDQISKDLGLDAQFRTRRTASYTPTIRRGQHTGLLIESNPGQQTADSFQALTGSSREYERWQSFHGRLAEMAQVLAPSMLEPMVARNKMRQRLGEDVWRWVVEQPLGATVEEVFADDLVRGTVATDGVIGTFADLHDPDLRQNRTFLYHHVGNGTGDWRVPIGGMGALSSSIERAAWKRGAEVLTRAFAQRVRSDGRHAQVQFQHGGESHVVECDWVLGNVAPWVMHLLLGENPGPRPEGSQIKVNMLLDRLPRLRSGVSPPLAFNGTFHVGESYDQLQQAYVEAQEGDIPEFPPGELYCHSLTDPSVMGTLAMEGMHAFTFFGLHAPARLYSGHVEAQRDETVLRILDAINVYLEEPIENLISLDENGNPCLEAMAPQDVEAALAMPGGHIWHGDLSWPWSTNRAAPDTPAHAWGVATHVDNVLMAGSGAARGGGVSGVAGHNAAMALLEILGKKDRTRDE
ncbi:phytoene desaturase family protein [Nocardioides marmoribigeumensis]|uniref:Phytoene dehydrogenase-like protein n=1 Tax=Nocardioides marmoribigeumensis TaxID=433649 RepID=A0ABU2C0K7_9ACTN|nr:NAD(P)/FAD-dependent oxidoreductase [Nocardioides marmoribigeumensis]MDR7364160.1 phytoene dehydrogenase-like protein [Nocardioides marmoribigeumensis]